MSRHITSTRFDSTKEPLYVCILAGGCGYREKSKHPKILHLHHGKSILDIQVETILKSYPSAHITITTGFQADKIIREKPESVCVIENQMWEQLNTVEEIRLYLNSTRAKRVLFIDGAVYFTHNAIQITDKPGVYYFKSSDDNEVGLTLEEGVVSHFSYGLSDKWGGLVYLDGKSLEYFRKICSRENTKLILFEALNLLIERGIKLVGTTSSKDDLIKLKE